MPRTTDSNPAMRTAPNRLLGLPAPTALDRVWIGDITCLPRQGRGWLYLAVWLDCCSRKIVGWDLRDKMPEDLVSEALRPAKQEPTRQLLRQRPSRIVLESLQGRITRWRQLP